MTDNNKNVILFLCKCSSNISSAIDFDDITSWAKRHRNVSLVVTANLLCSPKEKKLFAKVIKAKKAKSIVIAACSPKLHEKTFRDIAEEEGINISKIHMANIREHCAWVTKDKNDATKKAKKLINAAIKRSLYAEDLHKHTMKINTDVAIIGGGIAGMETARALSKAGRKVYLIEKEVSLGGFLIKTEEVAPNMECSPCLLAPVLAEIRDDPNIEVITNAEVSDVIGFFGNFSLTIKKKARYVQDTCIGCEECFNVCPVSVKNDFHYGLADRKAIYTLFPGSVPAAAVIDKENCKHFIDGSCDECVKVCPFASINFDDQDQEIIIKTGAVVNATGFENFNPDKIPGLNYKKIDNIYTTVEFERLASSNGPTGGNILLKDGNPPSSIAVIHCAGSMRSDGIPYCSKVCCLNSFKAGDLFRKKNPQGVVYNIHNSLVFSSPKEYNFYLKQKKEGSKFVKSNDLPSIKINKSPSNPKKIRIGGSDIKPIEVDMVVLSTGLLPAKDSNKLAEILNVEIDKNGYYMPDHEILHTTGSALDGVYIAGCALKPNDAPSSITQAQSVAGDILGKFIPGKELELEVMTSEIDKDICAGCKLCIISCPYKAITYDKTEKVSVINEAICRGCGTCAAACPSGACKAKHFTNEQIFAEIGGILNE